MVSLGSLRRDVTSEVAPLRVERTAHVVWVVDEVDETTSDVVGELAEERLGLGFGQRSHLELGALQWQGVSFRVVFGSRC